MLSVNDSAIYNSSLEILSNFKKAAGTSYKGRFVQVFLALKFYQNELPSIHSGRFVNTSVLQTMIDELYSKSSKPLNSSVLSLFNNSYLPRTGIAPVGGSTPGNNWRNNFNIQKGIGCYAPTNYLASNTFLNERRIECRFIDNPVGDTLKGARCSLCETGAGYRNESHRKWLQIRKDGSGYAVTDLLNTSNFQPYVSPNGRRIPIVPLIISLYYDSNPGLVIGTRSEEGVDIKKFMSDFNFSKREFEVYFDDSYQNKFNSQLLSKFSALTYSVIDDEITFSSGSGSSKVHEPTMPIEPVLHGTPSNPPSSHSGWEAEQFVRETLELNGWKAYDVSRQNLGYDILGKKGRKTIYIEAKSSLSRCTPSLTSREWQQSRALGENYILAILENFDPTGEKENIIYFVQNPSGLKGVSESRTTKYSVPRNSWITNVIDLDSI